MMSRRTTIPIKISRRRDEGVALISVVIVLVVIGTAAADFAFNTRVDLTSAANARDDLRAHYLTRSGINLSRLLLKVQQRLIDPNRKLLGGMDIQIADYAPMLVSAFNSREGAEALGSLFGVEGGGIKGLGVDVGSFDLQMESLDGKLNLNCGGGANPGAPSVIRFAASLSALVFPPRYNRLFEEPDANGQYADRLEVMRAIIDWADQDTVMFGSSAPEDYRYNAGDDPYENKNHYYDTVEEIRSVKGVDDDFMAAFGDAFTVYGSCRVNVNLAEAPVLASLLIQHAASPTDPALQWENLALLVRYLIQVRNLLGGFTDTKSFIKAVEEPTSALSSLMSMAGGLLGGLGAGLGGAAGEADSGMANLPMMMGIKLDPKTINESIVAGGPRRIWRIVASADVGKVKKTITAIWDMKHISLQAKRHNMGQGGYLYWREE